MEQTMQLVMHFLLPSATSFAYEKFYELMTKEDSNKMEGKRVPVDLNRKLSEELDLTDISSSVVSVLAGNGHGSGFIISKDCYVLTNQHVIGDSSIVRLKFQSGLEINADVVAINRGRDIALLKAGHEGSGPTANKAKIPSLERPYTQSAPLRI